ncbi:hypothetical protein [Microbulbifer spongiae]|uniref:DUF4878 domain-containing protein n=1 Tax=Microbulbifer spongiae TaxID=2944933 RepID=A0ABY9EEU6_9GAMM|nr:hypothetical protein [Microbulbifer sp. MI-G]WKD49266.1 hypothetical protein M8T91_15380 [Microbulbifer sp. MI-G]
MKSSHCFSALLLFSLLVACSETSHDQTPRQVSEAFIQAYYIDDNLQKAKALTTGQARDMLDKEINLDKAYGEDSSDHPRIHSEFINRTEIDNNTIEMKYKVSTKEEGYLISTLGLARITENNTDQWRVSSVTENNHFSP